MGVLGEMFPGPKIRREAGEAGDGQGWRLGPVDLDNDVVELQPVGPDTDPDIDADTDAGPDGRDAEA